MTEIIKTEESGEIFEKVFYEENEKVFIVQFNPGFTELDILKAKVINYQEETGILTVEGLISAPGRTDKQLAKFRIDVFQTIVFKNFEKAKQHLQHELAKTAFNISRSLKVLEDLVEE